MPEEIIPAPAQVTPKAEPAAPVAPVASEPSATSATPKTTAGSESKKSVPEEGYKLELPKDSLLSQAALDEIAEFAKANELTNEKAQAVLERESASIAAYVENAKKAAEQAFVKEQEEWIKELRGDKDFGGDNFAKNAEISKRVISRFADEQFQKDLEVSGLGNHPGFNRLMLKLGKAMADDQLVPPTAPPISQERKSTAEVLFGEKK